MWGGKSTTVSRLHTKGDSGGMYRDLQQPSVAPSNLTTLTALNSSEQSLSVKLHLCCLIFSLTLLSQENYTFKRNYLVMRQA